jgi:arylsulfate sulfotransferase
LYQKYLLDAPKDFKYNAGQHAPIELPDQDNNENTIEILEYNNNIVITHGGVESFGLNGTDH